MFGRSILCNRIGSCSDRHLSSQETLWGKHNIKVDFVSAKHLLEEVKACFEADRYLHIGEREFDRQLAQKAGFDFLWNYEAVTEPWLARRDGHR